MNKFFKFLFLEIAIFLAMGLITFFEITDFKIFESFFTFIKTPSSWFVGLGLAYAFSSLFQKGLFAIFSRKIKKNEEQKKDFFAGFLIILILSALITPIVKNWAIYFFGSLFIYFHVILMQSIVVLYILFKLKEKFEISGKYFLVNELIILINTLVILRFVTN